MNDNLSFSEMSFSDDESSDESYETETSQSEAEEADERENMIRFDLTDNQTLRETTGPRAGNLFPVTPNVSAAYLLLFRMQWHLLQAFQ
jgi:hypothetical protein